mgnify:FL=1
MSLMPVNSTPTLAADELDTLRRTIGHDLDPNEFELFAAICRRTGLDPFARQIYAVKRWDGRQRKEVMQIQTGIDGLRLIAERSSNYAGQTPAEWCGEDGKWVDVWLSSKPPAAARVGVLRHDFEQPMYGVAKFSSYCAKTKDGKPQALWATMPEVMIAKCAEALAIRKAFPNDVSGVYTREEMAQQENTPAPVSRPSKPERVTAEVMPQVSGGGDAGTVPPAVVASPGVPAPDRQAPATTVEPAMFQQGEVGTAPPDGTAAVGGENVTGGAVQSNPSGDAPADGGVTLDHIRGSLTAANLNEAKALRIARDLGQAQGLQHLPTDFDNLPKFPQLMAALADKLGVTADGAVFTPLSSAQNRRMHRAFGDDNARKAWISRLTSGRTDSSTELYGSEVEALMEECTRLLEAGS